MATTFVDYTGDGNATKSFSFPSIKEADVKVEVDGVVKTTSTHYNITSYTTTGGGNVVFTSGNIPASPAAIRIYRDTDVDNAKATYTAGSSVKAGDLNNNNEQLLFAAQEEQNQTVTTSGIKDAAVTTAKIKADNITSALIADDQINSEHYVDGSIDTAHIADLQVTTAKIAADAVTGAKIADDSINSEHYVDGSIDTAHIANNQITTDKLNTNAVTTAKITDANITTAKIADSAITSAKIQGQAITNAKIAADSIDANKIVSNAITTAKIADSNVTTAKIADSAVTTAKIQGQAITNAKISANSIDANKIVSNAITTAKIASNAVTTDKIQDGELTTLAGMQSTTASNLASATALTATTAELNQLDGITLETSVTTNSDTRIPTSKAVNDLVLSVTNALGGFVAIANETSFPTANPDPSNGAGTVVSISQLASGLAVNGSGVATISNGAGSGNTVTITGFPSSLVSQTLPANSGLQVQTTTTLHTYTFHKQLASAADIQAISATVNSFSNRYRVSASAPTSSLDGGDLWYDTTNSKLMVYSSQNSAWEESSAIGNFFICTISSSSSTGGGSATANGTAYRFTISNAPQSAQSLIVSVDGVVQRPNAGSSQPSEGFVLVGNDIIFGSAPVNGASIFVTAIGSTVGIGTPSDNTVTTAILQNGSVTTAKIVDDAVTADKIANSVNSAIAANTAKTTNATHTGEVTGGTALTIADNVVDEANLKVSNSPSNGYFLSAQSGNTGGLTWAQVDLTSVDADTVDGIHGASFLRSDATDIKTAGHLTFNDNIKSKFGTGGDLEIYHDGNNSYITNSSGYTILDSVVGAFIKTNNEHAIDAFQDGKVALYYDGSSKFETTSAGATVTGALTVDNAGGNAVLGQNLSLVDNGKVKLGASDDLQIYHDGSDSFIKDTGTGALKVCSNLFRVNNAANSEAMIKAQENGGVELSYDSSKKFETTSGGAKVSGDLDVVGHAFPNANNTYDLGTSGNRWRNVYTNDLHLSNEGHSNDVDGTWGNWTIQEGESDLFLKNNRSGKKYKFNLTEVS